MNNNFSVDIISKEHWKVVFKIKDLGKAKNNCERNGKKNMSIDTLPCAGLCTKKFHMLTLPQSPTCHMLSFLQRQII